MVNTWPLPVSATKPMFDRVPVAPVQVTVHSMVEVLCGVLIVATQHDGSYNGRIVFKVVSSAPMGWIHNPDGASHPGFFSP
jgi:hypothetical protein